ncbi:MAG TPA: polymer-forming cytoskeletal protein [Patescibacteria group bacterium]|nr:polymer-forming cytoskeletal protein [Patescibacteria group bacterium]
MFGSKKISVGISDQVDTLLGKDTTIKGTILAKGTLRIDGNVEGDVTTSGDIVVGETGKLVAQIKARSATVAGTINGNLDIQEKLELLSSARLDGDIKVGKLIIGEGAVFHGACEMRNAGSGAGNISGVETVAAAKAKA